MGKQVRAARVFSGLLTLQSPMENTSLLRECSPRRSAQTWGLYQIQRAASAGSQREELRPWQRSWGRRLRHTQRRDQASGDPLLPSIYPQNQSAYFTVLCSHLHFWLYGGLSPIITSLGEGVNLQLQLIKIPGCDKSVSTYKLLWRFSSMPEWVRLATCDCLQPPNHDRHEML